MHRDNYLNCIDIFLGTHVSTEVANSSICMKRTRKILQENFFPGYKMINILKFWGSVKVLYFLWRLVFNFVKL